MRSPSLVAARGVQRRAALPILDDFVADRARRVTDDHRVVVLESSRWTSRRRPAGCPCPPTSTTSSGTTLAASGAGRPRRGRPRRRAARRARPSPGPRRRLRHRPGRHRARPPRLRHRRRRRRPRPARPGPGQGARARRGSRRDLATLPARGRAGTVRGRGARRQRDDLRRPRHRGRGARQPRRPGSRPAGSSIAGFQLSGRLPSPSTTRTRAPPASTGRSALVDVGPRAVHATSDYVGCVHSLGSKR